MAAKTTGVPLVTLENFMQHLPEPLNSPRSLEACLRQGIDPQELVPRYVGHVRNPQLSGVGWGGKGRDGARERQPPVALRLQRPHMRCRQC